MTDPYATEEESKALLVPDTRTPMQKAKAKLDDEQWLNEQGAEALAWPEQEPVGHGGRPMTLRECMEAEDPEQKSVAMADYMALMQKYAFLKASRQKPLTDEQADSIINGLRTCLHLDSKRVFLRTWLRDWADHGIKGDA